MLLLPMACLLLLTLRFYRRPGLPLTGAILISGLLVASVMFLLNLLLSAQHALTATRLSNLWLFTLAGLLIITVGSRKSRSHIHKHWRRLPRRWRTWYHGLSVFAWISVGIIAIVLTITFLIAVLALPNNYDSMTYHLPRIMHWLQNAQVSLFATNIERQNYQHPGAEYLQLQFFLLTTGQGSAMNLVQWLALVGCVLSAGFIARELGSKATGQWLAMVLVATWPMAIMQSTGTKNDLLLACMAMVSIWLILSMVRRSPVQVSRQGNRGVSLKWMVLTSLSLGWVLTIKGTSYVYLPPLVLGLFFASWHRGGIKLTWRVVGLACLVTASMMSLPWIMNQIVFGSVLGPESDSYRPSGNLLAAGLINAVRCTGSQLTTPLEGVNQLMLATMTQALGLLGLNINDVRSLNYSDHYFLFTRGFLSEDHAGAPWHMLWILLMLPMVALRGKRLQRTYLLLWLLAAAMFFVLVSWNQWINRLTLPLMLCA